MMSVASAQLTDSLQGLIDARLDTIDRMLLGRVPRQDRLAIGREVEAQIHDLLHERDTGDLSREDVLAVLGRLDPPEAYLSDELPDQHQPTLEHGPRIVPSSPTARNNRSILARASGILGLSALGMMLLSPLIYLGANLLESELILIGGLFLTIIIVLVSGTLAIVLAGVARLRGIWAIVGLASGIISLLSAFAGGGFLLLELL
jgi:hypothetical protein